MRHWLQIATRNWRTRRVRTAGALLAIALGTGAVVWVTCVYESVRQTVLQWAGTYVGHAHVTIDSPLGRYDTVPQRIVTRCEKMPEVERAAPLLVQRLTACPERPAEVATFPPRPMLELDVNGIDLEREPAVRDWAAMISVGRMLEPTDELACVLEASIARENGVGLGDSVFMWAAGQPDNQPYELKIVGLIERRRIARFLKGVALVRLPVLQRMTLKQTQVTSVDLVLRDPRENVMRQTATSIRADLRGDVPNAQVRSTAARLAQVERAQDQQQVILVLLSCVAMLTALFIILSTLSMGMVERIMQLGLLRCTGTTSRQMAALVLAEVVPLGLVGIALGVPVGLGLTALSVWLVPEYVGAFTVSVKGIALAGAAGFATTLVAALLPAGAAAAVSPLEATRPRARRGRFAMIAATAGLGAAALAGQLYVIRFCVQRDVHFVQWSAAAVVLLYVVYALVAPLAVWAVSRVAVPVVALLMGLRTRLLQDQVGHAVWRSAGICCGLMVGLSLIVGLMVFNQSFRSGWQFPKQFPEGYIWSFQQIDADVDAGVAAVGGVRNYTAANAVNVIVEERSALLDNILLSVTWFLGIDPDSFFDLVKLEFVEGDAESAKALLRQGGYVVVAQDFARSRNKSTQVVRDAQGKVLKSNEVRVWFNDRWTTFKVAAVVDSPALDIAAGYFQVESESRVVAAGSVIGTNADLARLYSVRGTKLVLLNFNLPDEEPPPDWKPPGSTAPAGRPTDDYYNTRLPLASRWRFFRETATLEKIRDKIQAQQAFYGTARELKDEIDHELTRMTYLLSAVPAVALLVAAIGVANLMTANVASRTRQLAILRAVGATRGQVLRLVVGEALVLGVLGSALGLGLGLHLAWNVSQMTQQMWGLAIPCTVPWGFVSGAIGLTIGLCILAGVIPARHASRTNVIAALHVA